ITDAIQLSPEIHFDAINRGASPLDSRTSGAVFALCTIVIIGGDLYQSASQHHFPSIAALWIPTGAMQLRPVLGEDSGRWPRSWDWGFAIYFSVMFVLALVFEPSRVWDWAFIGLAALALICGLGRIFRRP